MKGLSHIASSRMRVAWFSPLPPLASGVADYAADVLQALDRSPEASLEIDLVVDRGYEVADAALCNRHRILSVDAFRREQERGRYDARLFHFGNSAFHAYMLAPLFDYGGAVVLHEIVLDGLAGLLHARLSGGFSVAPTRALPEGFWQAVRPQLAASRFSERALAPVLLQAIVGAADAFLVHSRDAAAMLETYAPGVAQPILTSALGTTVPAPVGIDARATLRASLGISPDETIFAAFGLVQPDKGIEDILLALERASVSRSRLLLVGDVDPGARAWLDRLLAAPRTTHVEVLGRLDRERFRDHMRACDVAFALRKTTRGESSGALLELLAHGVPTVVYAQGSFAEFPDEAVAKVRPGAVEALAEASARLAGDPARRTRLGEGARAYATSVGFETRVADYLRLLHEVAPDSRRDARGSIGA